MARTYTPDIHPSIYTHLTYRPAYTSQPSIRTYSTTVHTAQPTYHLHSLSQASTYGTDLHTAKHAVHISYISAKHHLLHSAQHPQIYSTTVCSQAYRNVTYSQNKANANTHVTFHELSIAKHTWTTFMQPMQVFEYALALHISKQTYKAFLNGTDTWCQNGICSRTHVLNFKNQVQIFTFFQW